jgi:hypothetical protein
MMEPDQGGPTMDQDRQHTEQSADEELALLRRARFGKLPAQGVAPDDLVETMDTDLPPEEWQEPFVRPEWSWGP